MPDLWCPPPDPLNLPDGEVHVWRIPLERTAAEVVQLRSLLSPDEIARADRFKFDHHRRWFIAARGHLRRLIGRYLNAPPANLTFSYAERGKPSLSADQAGLLSFNVSHSADLALIAFARHREIGVDVERHKPMVERDRIASGFFAPGTAADYAKLPEAERPAAFFRAWSRTEAVMKGVGDGIILKVDVTVAPDDPPLVREVVDRPGEAGRWSLLDIDPGPGFSGALAVEGTVGTVRLFEDFVERG